jgi:two-component system, OmpR family, sensor histidine kinase MtrB
MTGTRYTGGARRLGRAIRELPGTWRGSLQLRVVSATMLLSVVIALALGWVLNTQIRDGLVKAKESSSLALVSSGFPQAKELISIQASQIAATRLALGASGQGPGADQGGSGTLWTNALSNVLHSLCSGASDETYQMLAVPAPDSGLGVVKVVCGSFKGHYLLPQTITPDLHRQVRSDNNSPTPTADWASTTLKYGTDTGDVPVVSATTPGLVYGHEIQLEPGKNIELYYAFPFVNEHDALTSDGRLIAGVGAVLVLALGGIAWFVTRLVVRPVRQAAGIAERLADGRLDERMHARGEDDLARLATSFNKMAGNLQKQINKLEELSRVQRRFVSDVSHELRTPLTTVRMAADVLHDAREDFDAPSARSAELLQTQLDRFEELLGDLLEISRFDAGAAVLDAEPVDLRALVHRVVETNAVLAERKGSEVRIVEPDRPCVAEIDPRRIERILRNLVVNAIEHSEGRPVVVKVAASQDAVAVAVRDYGVGLKPGESSLVFGRFWRADPARARTTGGTGLGLAISLEDARLHHGWLQAWGEPGGGSQFRLTLPQASGAELLRSPIPLEPEDSRHHKRQAELRTHSGAVVVPAVRNGGPDLTGLARAAEARTSPTVPGQAGPVAQQEQTNA